MLKRNNDNHGTNRLVTVLAVAAATAVVASLAVVGTAAAQFGPRFDDVPQDHYAYRAIDWAVDNKITRGCGDGTNFCPGKTLNRAQMVTFLLRYHEKFGSDSAGSNGTTNDEPIATLTGTGARTSRSVRLTEGRWTIDFEVEHDDRLAYLGLVAVDETDAQVVLVDEIVRTDDYSESLQLRISRVFGELDTGRIWFEVETRDDAEWTITVTEL